MVALDLLRRRQVEALAQVRASSAQLIASAKRLEVQGVTLRSRRTHFEAGARAALAAGREAEATDAVTQAVGLDRQIEELATAAGKLAALRQQLEVSARSLEARVFALGTQAETLRAQYGAARAAVTAGEAVAGLGAEDGALEGLVQQAQDQILWTQARAEAVGELLDAGALPPLGGDGAGVLSARVDAGALPSGVQRRLAELRSEATRPGDLPEGSQPGA